MQQVSIKQAFWDYNFTERQLLQKLSNGTRNENTCIIGRILENLPYETIWRYITLSELKTYFSYLHLRPQIKKIWTYTLVLWNRYEKKPSSR